MSELPDVHVVIVSYKHREALPKALESIKADLVRGGLSGLFTVVDNNKNLEGIREFLLEHHPDVHYIDPGGNVGYGRGNNLGLRRGDAKYVFFLNPDTYTPADGAPVVRTLIDFLAANPGVGCVGPKLLNADGTVQSSCYRFNFSSMVAKPFQHAKIDYFIPIISKHVARLHMRDFDHNSIRDVDWIMGSALLLPQEVIHRVGAFDPQYALYLEDCDLCRTVWEHGYRVVYQPTVTIHHGHTRHSAHQRGYVRGFFLNHAARKHGFSWMKYLWKWRGRHTSYAP